MTSTRRECGVGGAGTYLKDRSERKAASGAKCTRQKSVASRQRISIVRALLKDPKILVLDEALSALDVASEAEIRAAVERALPGRTVIMITHRVSSIRPDDQVMVVDQGRMLWSGRYGDQDRPGSSRGVSGRQRYRCHRQL